VLEVDRVPEALHEIPDSSFYRSLQIGALGKVGRDRRRQNTARPVRGRATHPRVFETPDGSLMKKGVDNRRAAAVPTLDQDARSQAGELPPQPLDAVPLLGAESGKGCGLGQVRGQEGHTRRQLIDQCTSPALVQESGAIGSRKDRIEDNRYIRRHVAKPLPHGADRSRASDHADLDRPRCAGPQRRLELLGNPTISDPFDAVDT